MSIAFSAKISSLRREKNITQKTAADALGISQALLSHYEKGIRECNLDFVVKAAGYYDVTTDYLLGVSENRHGNSELSDLTEINSDNQIKTKTLLRAFMYLLRSAENENELSEIYFTDFFSLAIEKYLCTTKNSDPKLSRFCDIVTDSLKAQKIKLHSEGDENFPLFIKTIDENAKKLIADDIKGIL